MRTLAAVLIFVAAGVIVTGIVWALLMFEAWCQDVTGADDD